MKEADVLLTKKVGSPPVIDERHHSIDILTEADFNAIACDAWAEGIVVPRSSVVMTRRSRKPGTGLS